MELECVPYVFVRAFWEAWQMQVHKRSELPQIVPETVRVFQRFHTPKSVNPHPDSLVHHTPMLALKT